MGSITYTSQCIFPVSGPPLERGTITIVGDRIESVNPYGERTPDVDLGDAAIIPGLVNAHTHLDLSGARGLIPPTDPEHFTDWLLGVIAYRKGRTAEQVQADIRAGLAESLKYGTTLIGDITTGEASYLALVDAPIRSLLFWELIGLTGTRFNECYTRFVRVTMDRWQGPVSETHYCPPTRNCRWSVSPHSPYSVAHDQIQAELEFGGGAIHFAESPAEMELLESRTGPMVEFLKQLGVWDNAEITMSIRELFGIRGYQSRRLYIHCNYLPTDVDFDPWQTVVYCPRTHAAFGHPPHAFRHFLARGVNVALGTDSLASNPDLDLFAEARFVFENRKDVSGETILKMATLNGAKALGWADDCGSLEAGKSADFVVMPLGNGELYEALFSSSGERRTMFQGQWRTGN